jgi:hypothetical protein
MTDAASILYPSSTPAAPAPAPTAAHDAASILYGPAPAPPAAPAAEPAAPTPTPTPTPAADADAAEAEVKPADDAAAKAEPLKIEVPENIRALREASATASDVLYANTIDPAIGGMFSDVEQLTLPERKAAAAELSRMARDVGLDHDDVAGLVSRAPSVRSLTPEQVTQNQAEAARLLRDEFGDRAQQALADAVKLATRDPRTKGILERSGLGNDPQTILKFARLAVRERNSGRL